MPKRDTLSECEKKRPFECLYSFSSKTGKHEDARIRKGNKEKWEEGGGVLREMKEKHQKTNVFPAVFKRGDLSASFFWSSPRRARFLPLLFREDLPYMEMGVLPTY